MKKCIVVDLDNTLWGGIVGEDGMSNLALSMTPPGNSFIAFQQALLDHYNKGIILAINSRNNEEDALEVIRKHPNQILKEHHFAAMRINWQDKATNIRELAQELNIGLDSMVFLDDDKTNRELVRTLVPEVSVPELPEDPNLYTRFLNSLDYFTSEVITDEDKMRGNLYVTERLRKEEEKHHAHKEDFLRGLHLELTIHENTTTSLERLAQLTEKTNQFNVFKKAFTAKEIEQFAQNKNYKVFHAQLQDKFGDYGIILFALVQIKGSIWHIESLLMSCRVFGRGVEDAFLSELVKKAISEKVDQITISFLETEKNIPAKDFINTYFNDRVRSTVEPITKPSWISIK